MTDFDFAIISYSRDKNICPKSPHFKVGQLRTHTCIVLSFIWRSAAAGIQNKLLTGTIIVMHSEKEASVVKSTGNIKENLEKSSEVAPLDGTSK